MKVTQKLTNWLVGKGLVAAGSDEKAVKAAAIQALADGKLDPAECAELQKEATQPATGLAAKLTEAITALAVGQKALADKIEAMSTKAGAGVESTSATAVLDETDEDDEKSQRLPLPNLSKEFAKSPGQGIFKPREKGAWEMYDRTKKELRYPEKSRGGVANHLCGQRVSEGIPGKTAGYRFIDEPSELERAAAGALIKWMIGCSHRGQQALPKNLRLTDHDSQLIQWALHECKWAGVLNGGTNGCSSAPGSISLDSPGRKLSDFERKALIDDAITGGLEAAPIFFDDAFILDPILHSEVFPYVNVVPVTRGRRIEAASFGNVTLQSGGGDEDATDLFDTTGFVSAFDTLIHVVDGAIELGLDFLSDSPLPIVDIVRNQYREVMLGWLDEQVCIGDGVQEPEGIMVATGTTSVSFAAGHTVGNWESLLFGVAKRFKKGYDRNRVVFVANETTYQRARGIPVGASDARRIFGMDEESYRLFDHAFGISDDMTNAQGYFANMGRYRMYRRLGMTIRSTGEGKELTRKNLWLICCRARWGGQLETGGAAAVSTNMPS